MKSILHVRAKKAYKLHTPKPQHWKMGQ